MQVVVDVSGGWQGVVDANLRRAGAGRTAGLVVPYHHAALRAVAGTALIATLSERFLRRDDTPRVLAAPDVISGMTYLMVWHPRLHDDRAHRWLRARARAAAAHDG